MAWWRWHQFRVRREGPPDLDELVKRLWSWIKGHGKRGALSQQSNGSGQFSKGTSDWSTVVLFAGGTLLALLAAKGFYVVRDGEVALVTRLGAYERTERPGLHFIVPWLEGYVLQNDSAIQPIAMSNTTMLTRDENLVQVDVRAEYKVVDPKAFVFNVKEAGSVLQQALESAVRRVVGRSEFDRVLATERFKIEEEIVGQLRALSDAYKVGVEISNVNIQATRPPEKVKEAFDDVVRAREENESYKNKALGYANSIIAEAEGKKGRLKNEALAYREEILARARGQIARFEKLLPEFLQSPILLKQRLYWETLQDVLPKMSKVITEGSVLSHLPLDKRWPTARSEAGELPDVNP